MFVSTYLVTVIAAEFVRGINQSDCDIGITANCSKHKIMLVPVVGPFLSTQPFLSQLLLGGPQIIGLVLVVAGIYQASRPVHRSERASIQVYPTPLPAGGILTATLEL